MGFAATNLFGLALPASNLQNLFISGDRMIELVCLRPEGATFIYSMSEHFYEGEDNEEQRAVWENWMRHFRIRFEKAHCSGHASREDLKEFIRKVKPDILIPVHTLDAEGFRDFHKDVRVPEKGKGMKI